MKALIIISSILTLINCSCQGENIASQDDRLELVPEPEKDLREEYEKQKKEGLLSDTSFMEFMGDELKLIREKLKPLVNRKDWTAVNKRKIETKNGNGVAEYYSLHGELRKVRFRQAVDSINRFVEYYINNDSIALVFERQTDKQELKNDPEFYEAFADSLFFYEGELIRIKSNMDCGSPFAADYLKEEQIRLETEFEKLLERIKH